MERVFGIAFDRGGHVRRMCHLRHHVFELRVEVLPHHFQRGASVPTSFPRGWLRRQGSSCVLALRFSVLSTGSRSFFLVRGKLSTLLPDLVQLLGDSSQFVLRRSAGVPLLRRIGSPSPRWGRAWGSRHEYVSH